MKLAQSDQSTFKRFSFDAPQLERLNYIIVAITCSYGKYLLVSLGGPLASFLVLCPAIDIC